MNCANKFDRIGDGLIQIEVSILKSIDFSDRDLPLSSHESRSSGNEWANSFDCAIDLWVALELFMPVIFNQTEISDTYDKLI